MMSDLDSVRPITLSLRAPIQSLRRACGHESASHAFPSLFLWQRDMGLSVCLREKAFAVSCRYRGEGVWFFPCGDAEAVLAFVRDLLDRFPRACFLYLRREDVTLLQAHFAGRFRFEPAEDASEYLYDRTAYVTLPGGKNRKIRESIHHLKSHHELRAQTLHPGLMNEVFALLEAWKPRTASGNYSPDRTTADLLMKNYAALDLRGTLVWMDGVPAAVAMGFPLSDRSFDIAFSKAPVREPGLLHYSRRVLADTLPDRFTVINGEEDLGIPGLRQAKRLEHPMGQIEMWEAYAEE